MPFSQSAITEVFPPVYRRTEVLISWASSAPSGTWYQVYAGAALAWWGQSLEAWLPAPSGPTSVAIGTVADASEAQASFAASLDPAPGRRATLAWQGGTYLSATIAGFRIYAGDAPGAAVDYTAPLATIAAYPAGIALDGFGYGGFGAGGFGLAAGSYSWTSSPLASGPWDFAVVPYDAAGNGGTAVTSTVAIVAPPRPPAAFAGTTTRLRYSLAGFGSGGFGDGDYSEPTLTLTWNPPAI